MEFDITLEGKDMSRFLLRHTYTHGSGIFGLVLGAGSAIGLLVGWSRFVTSQRWALGILAVLFLLYQPYALWNKGRKQMKNKALNKPFHYLFDDEGIHISQGEQEEMMEWANIRKVSYKKDAMYIYMTAISAFIIPKDQCDCYEELVQMIKEKINGHR